MAGRQITNALTNLLHVMKPILTGIILVSLILAVLT